MILHSDLLVNIPRMKISLCWNSKDFFFKYQTFCNQRPFFKTEINKLLCHFSSVRTMVTSLPLSTLAHTNLKSWEAKKNGCMWYVPSLISSHLISSRIKNIFSRVPLLLLNVYSFLQAPLPDTYRGMYREDHPNPAQAYADTLKSVIDQVQSKGRKV